MSITSTVQKSVGHVCASAGASRAMIAIGLAGADYPFLCFRFFWVSKRNEMPFARHQGRKGSEKGNGIVKLNCIKFTRSREILRKLRMTGFLMKTFPNHYTCINIIPALASSGSSALPKPLTLIGLGAVVAFWFFSATGKELGFRRQ